MTWKWKFNWLFRSQSHQRVNNQVMLFSLRTTISREPPETLKCRNKIRKWLISSLCSASQSLFKCASYVHWGCSFRYFFTPACTLCMLCGVSLAPPFDPNVCHHERERVPFGRALSPLLSVYLHSPILLLSHSPPLVLSVTLPWRTWWKWLFNHAERSTNHRARVEWFKGLFRAQLERERKGGWRRERERTSRVQVWLLYGTGHLSSTYLQSHFTNNCPGGLMHGRGVEWIA